MSETTDDEREHDLALLEIHRRVLRKLKEKQAQYGPNLPTVDALEIEDRQREIMQIEQRWGIAQPIGSDHELRPSPMVPPDVLQFLPYLANRTAQKDALRDALRRLDRSLNRPIMCVIHGDEHQAQDMFLERLKKYILPEVLGVPKELAIIEYALPWPDRYTTAQSFPALLPRRIAEVLQASEDGTLEELNARLAAQMAPVMLSTFLLTQDWERHGVEGLRSFIRFWQHWPPLGQGQVLIVCLFVTFQMKREGGFFARFRVQRTNDDMADAIVTLARDSFDDLTHVVLPRLEGVEQSEAEHWARSTETRNICPRDEVIAGIRAIYERWEKKERSGAIPMEHLAKDLRDLLRTYTGQRREFA